MELIEEHKFEKFHVDTTAWLTFKGVVMARAQAESLYKAARETLKKVENPKYHRPNRNKIDQWKHYVKTFKLIDDSVNHELEIAIWREAIELAATKDASARNELDKLAEELRKHKAEKEAKKKLYDAAVKRYNTASTKLKAAKEAVAKLLKAKKDLEGKID
jgi:exonuclease VII small subunit